MKRAGIILFLAVLLGACGEGGSDSTSSSPVPIVETFFFSGSGQFHDKELWKSDGTVEGTVLVKNIHPAGSSSPQKLITTGGKVYFLAEYATAIKGVWRSDGTEQGTVLVQGGFIDIHDLVEMNGWLFFAVSEPVTGFAQLWKIDAATGSPSLVKAISHPHSVIYELTPVNGLLLFAARDGVSGPDLWKSDGTEAGTGLLKDIFAGDDGSIDEITSIGEVAYFKASRAGQAELWACDGTPAGTKPLNETFPGPSTWMSLWGSLNHTLLVWTDAGSEPGLWRIDRIPGGIFTASPIALSTFPPPQAALVGDKIYFLLTAGDGSSELWMTDGTVTGTLRLDFLPGEVASGGMHGFGSQLYFVLLTDGSAQIWKTDGTPAGTSMVTENTHPKYRGVPGAFPPGYLHFDGKEIYYTLSDMALWKTNGTEEGTVLVRSMFTP